MKKILLLGIIFSSSAFVSLGASYFCITSSDSRKNVNFCRTLSSGNGDMCFTFGSGTACYKTGQGSGVG